MTKTVGEIQKNSKEKVMASLIECKERPRVDIRIYFLPDEMESDEWKPTKKGINLGLDKWDGFKDLLNKIDQAIKKSNWLFI